MSSPGLKSTVKLEAGPPCARLVDSATGRSLVLSDTEALLLEFWDGTGDPSALAKAAADASLPLDLYQIAVFFTRLNKAGFIAAAPAAPMARAVPAPQLALTDIVPRFRADLKLVKSPDQGGAMQVKDPQASRAFTLFDFELSIARMLDGKRTAAQVIEAAKNIGIPVTLESLRSFVAQLRVYRFTADAVSTSSVPAGSPLDEGTWGKRRTWTPQVRELFQKALKLSREDHPVMALPVLDDILRLELENEEARTLKARVEMTRDQEVVLEVDFEELHGEEVESGSEARTNTELETQPEYDDAPPFESAESNAGDQVRETMHSFDVSALVSSASSEGPPPLPRPSGPSSPQAVSMPIPVEEINKAISRYRQRRVLLGLGLAVVVLVAGALLRPVPWRARVEGCRLLPTEVARPLIEQGSVVLSLEQKDGVEVAKGEVLAKVDLVGLKKQLADQEALLASAEKRVAEMEAEPCDPKVRVRSEAKVALAQRDVDFIRRDQALAEDLTDEGKKARTLKVLAPIAQARLEALAQAQAEHEELTLDLALQKAKDDVVAARSALEELRKQRLVGVVTAPSAGLFLLDPENAVGQALEAGESLGRVVSRIARVEADGPFPKLAPLPEAKLVLDVIKLPLENESWIEGEGGGRMLTGTVEIRDGTLFRKLQRLEVGFGQRPYFKELTAGH